MYSNKLRAEFHPWILKQLADKISDPGRVIKTGKHKMSPVLKMGGKEEPENYLLCLL